MKYSSVKSKEKPCLGIYKSFAVNIVDISGFSLSTPIFQKNVVGFIGIV